MPTTQLTDVLQALSSAAFDDLSGLWRLAAPTLAEALQDLMPDLVDTWGEAAASAAADWYDEYRESQEIPGSFTALVEPPGDLGGAELAGWAAEPLRLDEPDVTAARSRLEDGFQKRLVNSANRTVTGSTKADPNAKGYMRRTRPEACDFCIMVASRPVLYTETAARFACHGHCYCEAVPVFGGRPLPVRDYTPSKRPNTPEQKARAKKWIKDNLGEGKTPPQPPKSPTITAKPAAPKESKRDIAARQLPGLEKSLAELRARGLPEDSPQIQYHLKAIAKFRRLVKG